MMFHGIVNIIDVTYTFFTSIITQDPAVLLEIADNDVIRALILLVVTDGIEDTVKLTIYYFTDPTKHKLVIAVIVVVIVFVCQPLSKRTELSTAGPRNFAAIL